MAPHRNDRLRKYREAIRLAVLRRVQGWVPNTRPPSLSTPCREQSARLLYDPQETEMLELIEVVSDHKG